MSHLQCLIPSGAPVYIGGVLRPERRVLLLRDTRGHHDALVLIIKS
jgi:hypothetical protein